MNTEMAFWMHPDFNKRHEVFPGSSFQLQHHIGMQTIDVTKGTPELCSLNRHKLPVLNLPKRK